MRLNFRKIKIKKFSRSNKYDISDKLNNYKVKTTFVSTGTMYLDGTSLTRLKKNFLDELMHIFLNESVLKVQSCYSEQKIVSLINWNFRDEDDHAATRNQTRLKTIFNNELQID